MISQNITLYHSEPLNISKNPSNINTIIIKDYRHIQIMQPFSFRKLKNILKNYPNIVEQRLFQNLLFWIHRFQHHQQINDYLFHYNGSLNKISSIASWKITEYSSSAFNFVSSNYYAGPCVESRNLYSYHPYTQMNSYLQIL